MSLHIKLSALNMLLALFLVACGGSDATAKKTPEVRTPVPGVKVTRTETASYQVELWIGPVQPDFPIMSSSDRGQPVNGHLEVHIFDRGSGSKLTDIIPSVRLTHLVSGISRELAANLESGASQGTSFVTACLISKHRELEPHFGDNIYLASGTYNIIFSVGDETAEVGFLLPASQFGTITRGYRPTPSTQLTTHQLSATLQWHVPGQETEESENTGTLAEPSES